LKQIKAFLFVCPDSQLSTRHSTAFSGSLFSSSFDAPFHLPRFLLFLSIVFLQSPPFSPADCHRLRFVPRPSFPPLLPTVDLVSGFPSSDSGGSLDCAQLFT
jgi:hypothetical protein